MEHINNDNPLTIYIPQLWEVKRIDNNEIINELTNKINKTGDTMLGTLDMSFNKITNLSNLTDQDPGDACSYGLMRRYVDFKLSKPVISVWAAKSGALHINSKEWSFGEKGRGGPEVYPILVNSRIIHGMITMAIPSGAPIIGPQEEIVQIEHNGRSVNYKMNQTVKQFNTPLELTAGDIINFILQ